MAQALEDTAFELGMDVLVEVHDEAETGARAETVVAADRHQQPRSAALSRSSLETSERLAPLVPADRLLVSESGIFTHDDCLRLAQAGIGTFLVGESLMRQADVAAATRALLTGDAPVAERGLSR